MKVNFDDEITGIYKIRASCQTEYVTQALKIKRQRKKNMKKLLG